MLAALKGEGPFLGLVARELALDLGTCELFPTTAAQLPGVAKGTADYLSRRCDPSSQLWMLPSTLLNVRQVTLLPRGPTWYRMLVI